MGGKYLLGLRSQNLLRQERHQVSGMTHRENFELTGPTERVTQLEDKMTGVYPIDAKLINHGSTESIKALNRRLHWRKRGIVCQHDPRDADVLVKDLRLSVGSSSIQQIQVARCLFFSQDIERTKHSL